MWRRGGLVRAAEQSLSGVRYERASSSFTHAKEYDELPKVGSFMKLWGWPYGFERAFHKMNEYRKSHDPENIGLLRFTNTALNREGDGRLVFVFRPEDVETMYRNEGTYPSRGRGAFNVIEQVRKSQKDFFPDTKGVVVEEGQRWQDVRSLLNVDMMRPNSADYYMDQLQLVCEDFVTLCKHRRDSSTLIAPDDHLDDFRKFGIEAISVVALNTRLNCLDPSAARSSDNQEMMDAMKAAVDLVGESFFGIPLYAFLGKLSPKYRKLIKLSDTVGRFVQTRLDEAKEGMKNKPISDDVEVSVLEKLIARAGPNSSVPFVTAHDMLLAGIDNTGNGSGLLMYNLATNPDVQEKLREEILTCTGGKKHVTKEGLANMRYLRCCIKESLRLFPANFLTLRLIPNDIVIRGYKVPKNTILCWSQHVMGRDNEVFANASSFKPERWLRDNKGEIHPFSSLPFSHGPRSCIGKRFAEMEMKLLTIKMMQNFRVEWPEANGKVDIVWKLLNRPDKPLNLKYIDL